MLKIKTKNIIFFQKRKPEKGAGGKYWWQKWRKGQRGQKGLRGRKGQKETVERGREEKEGKSCPLQKIACSFALNSNCSK